MFCIVFVKFASFKFPKVSPLFFALTSILCKQFNDLIYIQWHTASSSPCRSVRFWLRSACVLAQSSCADERAARHEHHKPRPQRSRVRENVSVSLNKAVIVIDDRSIGFSNNAENAARTPEQVEDGGFCEERFPVRLRASAPRGRETEILRIGEVWKGWQKMFKVRPCRLQERPASAVPQQLQKMSRN